MNISIYAKIFNDQRTLIIYDRKFIGCNKIIRVTKYTKQQQNEKSHFIIKECIQHTFIKKYLNLKKSHTYLASHVFFTLGAKYSV